jgi:hypothetical protein
MEEHATIHWMNDFLPWRLIVRSLGRSAPFCSCTRYDDKTTELYVIGFAHGCSGIVAVRACDMTYPPFVDVMKIKPGHASRSQVARK